MTARLQDGKLSVYTRRSAWIVISAYAQASYSELRFKFKVALTFGDREFLASRPFAFNTQFNTQCFSHCRKLVNHRMVPNLPPCPFPAESDTEWTRLP